MKTCPITYEEFTGGTRYSPKGLRRLSPQLKDLKDLPFSAEEQRQEAIARATKMSVQGVQLKLSALLNVKECSFDIVDIGGRYILKPPSVLYKEIPENEDLTMRLASSAGIEVPFHGLVYSKDGSRTYFIKRFDRTGRKEKLPVEDFAQLSGKNRETKYDSTMEQVAGVIEHYCTFPLVEHLKLFKLTLVSYLVGNEDMHLKNFSVIRREGKIELSPAYDLLSTTIEVKNATEEIALPIRGRKRNLSRTLLIDYFARERLGLTAASIGSVLEELESGFAGWEALIGRSFLSSEMKEKYRSLLSHRRGILF